MEFNESRVESQPTALKIVVIGNAGVGKTCVTTRLIQDRFTDYPQSTVGAMYIAHRMEVDGKRVNLHLWDTAGQERLRVIAPLYYRDADIVIFVYDLTNVKSFEGLSKWYDDYIVKGSESSVTIFIGNKADKEDQISVTEVDAVLFANERKSTHFMVSAKSGLNIKESFTEAIRNTIKADFGAKKSKTESIMRKEIESIPREQRNNNCC